MPALGVAQEAAGRNFCDLACELLRDRIEMAGVPPHLEVADEFIYASEVLPSFYEERGYVLAWSGNDGPLPRAYDLVKAVEGAGLEGLRPADYHLELIKAALERLPGEIVNMRAVVPHLLVDLDLLLSDAFLVYASHLVNGHVDPVTIDPEWFIEKSEIDLPRILQEAIARNRIANSLAGLLTRAGCAAGLRDALARYQEIAAAGGWPAVPEGPKLEKGDRDDRVWQLRLRLAAEGYLDSGYGNEPDYFDDDLDSAVRIFQERNGLEIDGIVGRNTLRELNVTAEERARQIKVNMERWRWLPRELDERHIIVNIASFEVRVFEAGYSVLDMRAIVGREYRRTPVFSDVMTYLVLNPHWNVPNSIAVKDKIPIIQEDPNYLPDHNMRVFDGWGADAREIDPAEIDWSSLSQDNFPYRLRQDPGPANALGRIKFMFPNRFSVYLHDTPARQLFDKPVRAFSSGCIRIEKPLELAEYLLRADPEWTRASILANIDGQEEETVRLPEPIRVYLLYCTSWVGEDGKVQFRADVYGRDKAVADALSELPPEE
jgi:murein L,D-transpeptidase YcbB/YkuD